MTRTVISLSGISHGTEVESKRNVSGSQSLYWAKKPDNEQQIYVCSACQINEN